MTKVNIPLDLQPVLGDAWNATRCVSGYLLENEAKFLGLLAACAPAKGLIVEIGSFKGRSTVMLAKVASHYRLGPVVAIDPHNSPTLLDHRSESGSSSYPEFVQSLQKAGVSDHVESHRAYSHELAATWDRPIRVLWIDGDHSYEGAKKDLEGFLPHMVPYGVVAFHDVLHPHPGPIRVFVEEVLRSNQFGAAGFVHSIAWAQFRPEDGGAFQRQRASLERAASRLIPFVQDGNELRGFRKGLYKLSRFRVPHSAITPNDWSSLLEVSSKHSQS